MMRSLNSGASALKANQYRMDVISNNIANSSTTGYKSASVSFQDQFSQTYRYGKSSDTQTTSTVNGRTLSVSSKSIGGINPYQIGLGVKVGSVTNNMSQGTLETTNRALDIAIQGSGFFIYDFNGQEVYSRAGTITRDEEGYLVDSSTGAYLQGYNIRVDADGVTERDSFGNNVMNTSQADLRISPNIISSPRQTENVELLGNLNSSDDLNTTRETSITIYDNQGQARALNVLFEKTADNTWEASFTLDGKDVCQAGTTTPYTYEVNFNDDGTIVDEDVAISGITTTMLNEAVNQGTTSTTNWFDTTRTFALQLGDTNNKVTGSVTQFSGTNTVTASSQDGFTSGELQSLSVAEDGQIIGSFSNGQSETLGQILLAKFTNDEGLSKEGDNFFSISPNSGLPIKGTAGEQFASTTIAGGSLESSNVDLTDEFVNMIKTQRAFEAASRTITVSDTLLGEINQLKR